MGVSLDYDTRRPRDFWRARQGRMSRGAPGIEAALAAVSNRRESFAISAGDAREVNELAGDSSDYGRRRQGERSIALIPLAVDAV